MTHVIVSRKELLDWHKAFLKDFPSGRMDRSDFSRIFGQYFPFGESKKLSEHVFSLFDGNEDGFVDFRDYVVALSRASRGDLSDRLRCKFLNLQILSQRDLQIV